MIDELPKPANAADETARANFLTYPVSRLGPRIVPQDLTNFKSRGIGKVERELQQELVELRERYLRVIDDFNWNKLIYEAHYRFEPIIGEVYHLYAVEDDYHLSMIGPHQWSQRWVGSFRLNSDARWQVESVAEDFDLRQWVGNESPL
jgi:hypothetical protein